MFGDQPDKETIAKYTLDYYLPMMFGSKWVDGCYVDSLGRWCGFYNYRTDHFRYTTLPLTYAGFRPQPCIWNLQSHAEYLWELESRLHKQNRIVIANGVHPDRVMLGFAVDVMGEEGTRTLDAGEAFAAVRVPRAEAILPAERNRKEFAEAVGLVSLHGAAAELQYGVWRSLMRKYLPTNHPHERSGLSNP